MKKVIAFAFSAICFSACNNPDKTETTTLTTNSDSMTVMPSNTNTDVASDNNTTKMSYNPAEGDVIYRDGKVMVWRNNNYVVSDKDITMSNGVIVRKNGEVKNEDKVVMLEDGESYSTTGKFFNKAGEGIEDAWDATKKGVNKAAGAVKKAGSKVGEEVKEAVN